METSVSLTTSAAVACKQAILALNGHLETDVEDAASICWRINEKSVQIKGRFLRSKTLIIEEPTFVHDAEHHFGEVLSEWEDRGAGAVAAAGVEAAVSEERMIHSVSLLLQQGEPCALLQGVDSLLQLYETLHSLEISEMLPNSLKITQQLCSQLGAAYLTLPPAENECPRVASLAAVIAKYGAASEWAAALLQPQPHHLLPVLQAVSAHPLDTSAVLNVLRQCDCSAAALADEDGDVLALLPRALSDLLPVDRRSTSRRESSVVAATTTTTGASSSSITTTTNINEGQMNTGAVVEVCKLLHASMFSVVEAAVTRNSSSGGGDNDDTPSTADAAVADSMLQMLLAASKGISPATLRRDLRVSSSMSTVSLTELANWIFSARAEYVQSEVVQHLVSTILWEWLAMKCPAELRLKWFLAVVAAVKSSAQFSTSATDTHIYALCSEHGWQMALAGVRNEEDANLLCHLEVPLSESPIVQLLWRQIQVTVALALCSTSPAAAAATTTLDAAANAAALLETVRVSEVITEMVQSARSRVAVTLLGHVINTCEHHCPSTTAAAAGGSGDSIDVLRPTLSLIFGAVLMAPYDGNTTSSSNNTALDILSAAVAQSVRGACVVVDDDGSINTSKFTAVATWLGLFVGELAQGGGGGGVLPPSLYSLVTQLIRALYFLLGESESSDVFEKRVAVMALSLMTNTRGLPEQRSQQLLSHLFSSPEPWMRVLGAWIGDALALGASMPELQTTSSVEVWTLSQVNAALTALTTAPSAIADESSAEAAANEVFQLQDAAITEISSADPLAAAVLWHELFYRVQKHWTVLHPLLNGEEVRINITATSQRLSSLLATKLTALLSLMENGDAVLPRLMPFAGSFEVVHEASDVDSTWKQAACWSIISSNIPSTSSSSYQFPLSQQVQPFPDLTQLSFLEHKQQQQQTALAEAAVDLRYWIRRAEKAAVRPEGEEVPPGEGREGDVPASLAEAQRLLWEGSQRWKNELWQCNSSLRQRICQQYNPVDEQFLQETSEAFSDGQRIPRKLFLRDPQHARKCRELRQEARGVAVGITTAKEVTLAATELFKFEYLLLEAVEQGEMPQERALIRSKLLAVVAESLVDGSTPPYGAAPFVVGLFERAVNAGEVRLDTDAKLRIVPRIAAAVAGSTTGAFIGAPLPPPSSMTLIVKLDVAVRLLKACLDPDALLNAGKLRDFYAALVLVEGLCRGVAGDQSMAMLASFDANRFAVLVAENPEAMNNVAAARSSSNFASSSSAAAAAAAKNKSKEVSIEELLNLAAHCLTHPGSAATGAALLEGLLSICPSGLYVACLGVVLHAPRDATGRRDSMLSMLGRVPMEMIAPPILAEALGVLTDSLTSGFVDPPELPYELLGSLLRAAPVLQSLRAVTEVPYSTATESERKEGVHHQTMMMENSRSLSEKCWTIRRPSSGGVSQKGKSTSSSAGASGSGSSSGSSATTSPEVVEAPLDASTPPPPPSSITLYPVPSTHPPLAVLADEVLGASMEAVLRALRSGAVNAVSGCDHVQQLLTLIFEICGNISGNVEWMWGLYQRRLSQFLSEAATATGGATNSVFQQYWASLPWSEATFHLRSPHEVALIRAYLASEDRAAAELLYSLDWTAVVSAAAPPISFLVHHQQEQRQQQTTTTSATTSGGGGGVFTLIDEDDEEEEEAGSGGGVQQTAFTSSPASRGGSGVMKGSQSDWAAELGLLLLHAAIFLPQSSLNLPQWAQSCLSDEDATVQLLASANWTRIEHRLLLSPTTTTAAAALPVPWLTLPLLLCPRTIQGDVGQRVVHAASILSKAALLQGSSFAATVVAKAIRPLLALSICQGINLSLQVAGAPSSSRAAAGTTTNGDGTTTSGGGGDSAAVAALAASLASHQLVDIPADIPEELLEGTVELEQYRLQKREQQLLIEAAAVAAAEQQHQSPSQTPVIEVSGCFRFTPVQHVVLIRDVLGPLAAKHALLDGAFPSGEQCIAEVEPSSSSSSCFEGLQVWNGAPSALAHFAAAASMPSSSSSSGGGGRENIENGGDDVATLCLSLLYPLLHHQPLTILTKDALPFRNADLPWCIESAATAVFIAAAGTAAAAQPQQHRGNRSMRALRRQLSTLLHRIGDTAEEASAAATDPNSALNATVVDGIGLMNLIAHVVEDAAVHEEYSQEKKLGACLLRCVMAAPSTHSSGIITLLAENIVRAMASPPPAQTHHPTSSFSVFSSPSSQNDSVPVIAAIQEGSTVTTLGEGSSQQQHEHQHQLHDQEAEDSIKVPASMHFAAKAAASLDSVHLLTFAQSCARMKRPLLCAFALVSARHASSMLDKFSWQERVVAAIQAAHVADGNAEHPLEVCAPWLEILQWIHDNRWRRLPPGPHKAALLQFLSSLDSRVEILEILTPEELTDPGDREKRNPLVSAASAAADRLRQLGHSASEQHHHHAEHAELGSDHPAQQHHPPPPPPSSLGGISESISEIEPQEDPTLGRKFASKFTGLKKNITKALNKKPEPSSSSTQQPTPTTIPPPPPITTTTMTPSLRQLEAIEPERDLLVRNGLAAFAVTSYIRSVIDPRLNRRTASGAEPPAMAGSPRVVARHSRGTSSLSGSMHFEEAQISELDTILEARVAVDMLSALEASPLLARHRQLYAPFLDRMPQLLSMITGVKTFYAAVGRLLMPREEAERVLAVLAHTG